MAELLGTASTIVGLLDAVLQVVQFFRQAKDDVEDAPKLTRDLVTKVTSAGAILERIKTVVDQESLDRKKWVDLETILGPLASVLEKAVTTVAKNLKKEERRKEAHRVVEIVKAALGQGASKQKSATKGTLDDLDNLLVEVDRIANIYILESVQFISRAVASLAHVQQAESLRHLAAAQQAEMVRKLVDQADACLGHECLNQFHCEFYDIELKRGAFRRPRGAELLAPEPTTSGRRKRSGREGGVLIPNSTRIRFSMKPLYGEWWFYVVLHDKYQDTAPELFFPRKLDKQDNKLTSARPRVFPFAAAVRNDPESLILDRAKGIPTDQDSPQWIFIVVASQPLSSQDGALLTIEDVVQCLDQTNGIQVLVKRFIFDIMKQGSK